MDVYLRGLGRVPTARGTVARPVRRPRTPLDLRCGSRRPGRCPWKSRGRPSGGRVPLTVAPPLDLELFDWTSLDVHGRRRPSAMGAGRPVVPPNVGERLETSENAYGRLKTLPTPLLLGCLGRLRLPRTARPRPRVQRAGADVAGQRAGASWASPWSLPRATHTRCGW